MSLLGRRPRYRGPEGHDVNEWVSQNSTIIAVTAAVFLVIAGVLLVLWLRSVRNGRLLSRELDDADRELAALGVSVAEQGARLRIVRELHDIAVHSVSTIVRQTDVARYVVDTDPTAAARSAELIADIARETLAELRRIVTVASEGETPPDARPSIEATVGLLETMRDSGLVITFVETGDRFDLQQGAEVAIYRILEEALSNALTHGGPGTDVKVTFTWTAESLQVLVDDDGVQAEARRQGVEPGQIAQQRRYTFQDDLNALTDVVGGDGITEMRRRAATFGGVFNAYSVPGVGFSVSAIFPALRYDNGVHSVNLQR